MVKTDEKNVQIPHPRWPVQTSTHLAHFVYAYFSMWENVKQYLLCLPILASNFLISAEGNRNRIPFHENVKYANQSHLIQ